MKNEILHIIVEKTDDGQWKATSMNADSFLKSVTADHFDYAPIGRPGSWFDYDSGALKHLCRKIKKEHLWRKNLYRIVNINELEKDARDELLWSIENYARHELNP